MNVRYGKNKRKAISPVLATVILIAITLIAAIAIAGFVFGLFGSFTSSATISASAVNVQAALSNAGLAATCQSTAPTNDYIAAQNTGTASASVTNIQITYGGTTSTLAISGCKVTAGSTEYIVISALAATPTASTGEAFSGALTLSNGGSAPFSGTFQ